MIITDTRETSALAWLNSVKKKKKKIRPKQCSIWLVWREESVEEQKHIILLLFKSKRRGKTKQRESEARSALFFSQFSKMCWRLLCISTVLGNEYLFSEIWLSHGRSVKYRIFCLLAADFWLSKFLLVQVFLYEYSYLSSKQGQQTESWRESQHSPKLCQ